VAALGILLWLPAHAWAQAPKFPAKNVKEFIAVAKKNPGKLNFSSSGSGSSQHLAGELLKIQIGVDTITETPEYFRKYLQEEIERWSKVVRASKAKPE